MQVLSKYEQREFDYTFEYIARVGSLAWLKKDLKVTDILSDKKTLPAGLIYFIRTKMNNDLKKVNLWFNDVRKKETMKSLIKYCFDNKIQPYDLRDRGILSYLDYETPAVVTVYEAESK